MPQFSTTARSNEVSIYRYNFVPVVGYKEGGPTRKYGIRTVPQVVYKAAGASNTV